MAKISAKKFVEDVKDGKDDLELMKKYKISADHLRNVYEKLVDAGLLSRQEIESKGDNFECPACGLVQENQFDTCPKCGLILAKFKGNREPAAGSGSFDEAVAEGNQRTDFDSKFSSEDVHGEEGLLHLQTSLVLIILLIGVLTFFNVAPGISIIVLPFLFMAAYSIPFLVKEYGKLLVGVWVFLSISVLAHWTSDSRTRDPEVEEIISIWVFITAILIISFVFKNWPLFVARAGKLLFSKVSFIGALLISLVIAGSMYYYSPFSKRTQVRNRFDTIREAMASYFDSFDEDGDEFPRRRSEFDDLIRFPIDKRGSLFDDPYTTSKIKYKIIGNKDDPIHDFEFRSAGPDLIYGTEDDIVLQCIERRCAIK